MTVSNRWLTIEGARTRALKVYEDRRDKLGYDEWTHVEAVATAVSKNAQAVAYWHDAVEDGLISWREAYSVMHPVQFEALLLVTREKASGLSYRGYIEAIRDAPGVAGEIAREIKRADLDHNMSRDTPEHMRGMREPEGRYGRAKAILGGTP